MSIRDFFRGRYVFVTGATGFMGKVLIEKLVRSCPDIGKVCILMRHKKEKDIDTRLKEMLEVKLFDTIKEQKPGLMEEKLLAVHGDVTELRLGLSDKDYDFLIENVSVIFHVAASVRFDDPIRDATIMNVRGTREVVRLAKDMTQLAVMLHVSTTYCNCIREYVEEKVYEAPVGWREAISIAENLDPALTSILTKKMIGSFPNSYTFTKLLAEQIIDEERNNIPVVIFRPSIVMSILNDPIKGWIDNFNGPNGIVTGFAKGIVHISLGNKSMVLDIIAVDLSIKSMIVAAWYRTKSNSLEDNQTVVYNSASVSKSISLKEMTDSGLEVLKTYPFEEMIWYPSLVYTTCTYYFYFGTILKQIIPAILIDTLLDIIGKPHKRLLPLQQKIYTVTMALSYFMTKTWTFKNSKFLGLIDKIPDEDREEFDYDFTNLNIFDYVQNSMLGSQKYLFNFDLKRLPSAQKKFKLFLWINRLVDATSLIICLLLLIKCNTIPNIFL